MTDLTVRPVEIVSMRTRDGVRLDADVYRPVGAGPWPVLLLRQAYGRRVACTVCYAHPRWYAAQGYVVVVQDIRGRGTSEGMFDVLAHDAADGADTIAWCAGLPDTTGAVGTYGFSYQGSNQLMAATLAGPALRAMAPAMFSWSPRDDMAVTAGVPQLAGAIGWAAQLGADSARHRGDHATYDAMRAIALSPPLVDPVTLRPAVMDALAPHHHYLRWLDTPRDDPYWTRISPSHHLDAILSRRTPMLMVAGWYDFFLAPTLAAWRAIAAHQPDRTQLIVGPWAHLPWGQHLGARDFGEDAPSDVDRQQIAFFDRWLKGGTDTSAAVRLFDLAAARWRSSDTWAADEHRLYLAGDGRASVHQASGRLAEAPGEAGSDALVHDPWRPAPTCGGRMGSPPGPVDRRTVDQRGDVLTFTGPPLDTDLPIGGSIAAVLHVEGDAPSFDLFCTLSQIRADGQVHGFAEGVARVEAADGPVGMTIDMAASCITVSRGERLRLSIAAASFPAYAVNPGRGDGTRTTQMDEAIITLIVHHGGDMPSALVLGCPIAWT